MSHMRTALASIALVALSVLTWPILSMAATQRLASQTLADVPTPESVVWYEDHESGDYAGWSYVAISGDASVAVSDARARTGTYSLELAISGADGQGTSPGVRMEKHDGILGYGEPENLPETAFYSVFFYFPEYVAHDSWFWNVFQWKRAYATAEGGQSRYPTWVVNVLDRGSNQMTFMLESKVNDDNSYAPLGTRVATAPIDVPIGEWVHLECLHTWAMEPTGQITCWQDGETIWDVRNIRTDLDYDYIEERWQWTVNNYAADTQPTNHSIWIDDAAISLERLGHRWRSGRFIDDDSSVHEADIEQIAALGATSGCNPPANDRFCPSQAVTRGQMATFISRTGGLPAATGTSPFIDIRSSVHRADIDALWQAGVTVGCDGDAGTRYCPEEAVSRAEMASFLVRAFDLEAVAEPSPDPFGDDDNSVHESDIALLAAAGVTAGCNPPANDRYCPEDAVSREQMASFLARAVAMMS